MQTQITKDHVAKIAKEAKALKEFLVGTRSIGPQTGILLVEVAYDAANKMSKYNLSESDQQLVKEYIHALKIVTTFVQMHQAVVIGELEGFAKGFKK